MLSNKKKKKKKKKKEKNKSKKVWYMVEKMVSQRRV